MTYNRFQDPAYIEWARAVKVRDKFTCQTCKAKNTELNSHHCNSWDFFEDQRFDINNGITLCNACHMRFHEIYGAGKNTQYQLDEFRQITFLINKIAREHILG